MVTSNKKLCFLNSFLVIIILLFTSKVIGQNPGKKIYYPGLDSIWSNITHLHQLSNNGEWVLFADFHSENRIKNYIVNTKSKKLIHFENGNHFTISNNSKWLAYLSSQDKLIILDLKNTQKIYYSEIIDFKFDQNGDYIIATEKDGNNSKNILIINLNQNSIERIKKVYDYKINPINTNLVISKVSSDINELILYDFSNNKQLILKTSKHNIFTNLEWNPTGNHIIALENNTDLINIWVFSLNGKGKNLPASKIKDKFPYKKFESNRLKISEDGSQVFFYLENPEIISCKNNDYQIWNTSDEWILPKLQNYWNSDIKKSLIVWNTLSSDFRSVNEKNYPSSKANINIKYGLIFNLLQYAPEYFQDETTDFYLKNLESGDKTLLVSKLFNTNSLISISPSGNYISYFKDNHWWFYNIKTQNLYNITSDLDSTFEEKDSWNNQQKPPYGSAGWLNNEKFFIIYDEYDIWVYNTTDNTKVKITDGRKNKISYRINLKSNYKQSDLHYKSVNSIGLEFDFRSPIILEMRGKDLKTGIAIWTDLNETRTLVYTEDYIDNIIKTKDAKNIVYVAQKYNKPPAIYCINLEENKSDLIYKSNKKLEDYDLGFYENFKFTNSKSDTLNATLIYPANFDLTKEYPLIVHIYQNSSSISNKFVPPSNYGQTGFNIFKYVTNGYFVLLPDIKYEIGNPGVSALDCVVSAVNQSLARNYIDKDKIGLIGHSFGGYEASFISTQTNIFKTVVAGAPVTDLVSFYHDVQWGWSREQAWRLENQQFRMGDSYYNIKDKYLENSPLSQVEKMNTPLLLWTGMKDDNINSNQSIMMHIAMKRLNKEGKLIIFENEGHVIEKKKNQLILSNEIFNWFNLYLK